MNKNSRNKRNYRRRKRAKQAKRLAVYLDSAGVLPACEGRNWKEVIRNLARQYVLLPEEQRDLARAQGKERIGKQGLHLAAVGLLPALAQLPQAPRPTGLPVKRGRKCPRCRTWKFKTIWESAEAAKRFCAESGDAGLRAYPCPHGHGWHAGHIRNQAGKEDVLGNPEQEETNGGTSIGVPREAHPQQATDTLSVE